VKHPFESINQWRHGWRGQALPRPQNFGLSENLHLVGKAKSKNAKIAARNAHFGKIKILSTIIFSVENSQCLSEKLQLPAMHCVPAHPRRDWHQ